MNEQLFPPLSAELFLRTQAAMSVLKTFGYGRRVKSKLSH
jgi:hypothetical protein